MKGKDIGIGQWLEEKWKFLFKIASKVLLI